jgi:hypothetical protein
VGYAVVCIYCLAALFRRKAEHAIVDGRVRVNGARHCMGCIGPVGASYGVQAIQPTFGSSVSSLNHERAPQECAQGIDAPVVLFGLCRVLVLVCSCFGRCQYGELVRCLCVMS